jgi:hypothetical protein
MHSYIDDTILKYVSGGGFGTLGILDLAVTDALKAVTSGLW